MPLSKKDLATLASSNAPFEVMLQLTTNKAILEKVYKPRKHTWDWAAKNGHLNVLKWLHKHHKGDISDDTLDYAAANGHLKVVEWLHEHYHAEVSFKALELAAQHRHYEVVKFLLDKYEFTYTEAFAVLLRSCNRDYNK